MVAVIVIAVAVLSVVLSSLLILSVLLLLLIYQYYFLYQPLVLNLLHVSCFFTFLSFLRDYEGNKVAQLFCVITAIVHYGEVFDHSFNFNKFIFAYVVNTRFICDNTRYLLTYLWIKENPKGMMYNEEVKKLGLIWNFFYPCAYD